jgi:hypothetical protein
VVLFQGAAANASERLGLKQNQEIVALCAMRTLLVLGQNHVGQSSPVLKSRFAWPRMGAAALRDETLLLKLVRALLAVLATAVHMEHALAEFKHSSVNAKLDTMEPCVTLLASAPLVQTATSAKTAEVRQAQQATVGVTVSMDTLARTAKLQTIAHTQLMATNVKMVGLSVVPQATVAALVKLVTQEKTVRPQTIALKTTGPVPTVGK